MRFPSSTDARIFMLNNPNDYFSITLTVHCPYCQSNFLLFSVLTATYGPGQSSPRKVDWREAQDANIRSKDTRRSVSRNGGPAGVYWKSLQVKQGHTNLRFAWRMCQIQLCLYVLSELTERIAFSATLLKRLTQDLNFDLCNAGTEVLQLSIASFIR